MSLSKAVVDDIDVSCVALEESGLLLRSDANLLGVVYFTTLSDIGREHILGTVNVTAEMEVVHLLSISTIAVTANDQVKHSVAGRHDVQVFHDSKELLGSDVLRLGPIKVLEAGLEEDAVGNHMLVESSHHLKHRFFLLIREDLFEFTISIRRLIY